MCSKSTSLFHRHGGFRISTCCVRSPGTYLFCLSVHLSVLHALALSGLQVPPRSVLGLLWTFLGMLAELAAPQLGLNNDCVVLRLQQSPEHTFVSLFLP